MSKESELQAKLLKWSMTSNDIGLSSRAMAAAASGHPSTSDHPWDPDDLNRCIKLCREVPEIKEEFDLISKLSPTWSKLIERWSELEQCFIDEAGYDWSKSSHAKKTYNLMKEIIG